MRLALLTPAVLALSLLGSCSYLNHRGSDLLDVVSLGGERGSFFVSANIGPFRGLGYAYIDPQWGEFESDNNGWGLYGGHLGSYLYHKSQFWLIGNEEHTRVPGDRDKSFGLGSISLWPVLYEMSEGSDESTGERGPTWLQYGAFELNVGLFYGLRAGINVSEFCDLILGLATLDPAGDDR